jgi:hypothetical protein
MRFIPTDRAIAATLLGVALALAALTASASAWPYERDAQRPTFQQPTTSRPPAARSGDLPRVGPCPETRRNQPRTAGARPNVFVPPDPAPTTQRDRSGPPKHAPRPARGSDLEWAYLTIGGGATALTVIGFLATLAAEHHRRRRAHRPRSHTPA